jgi:hypothetical protein
MSFVSNAARVAVAVFALTISAAVAAESWFIYVDRNERFAVNFPAQPKVEDFTMESEYQAELTAKRYSVDSNGSQYIVTVINYENAATLTDLRGSIAFAATKYRQMGKVTYDAYQEIDRVPGHQLQITTPEGRRIFVGFNLYDRRLFILEANVPANRPPPELFRDSLQFLDANGMAIRLNDDGTIGQRRPIEER